MRTLLLIVPLLAGNLQTGFTPQPAKALKTKGIIVAFFDEGRLTEPGGQAAMKGFESFLKPVQEIAKRDFPDVEFRVLRRGELLRLPDGTGLNVQNIQPALGYVLSAPGKKRRVLGGVQTEVDLACAAVAFFRRPSSSCAK